MQLIFVFFWREMYFAYFPPKICQSNPEQNVRNKKSFPIFNNCFLIRCESTVSWTVGKSNLFAQKTKLPILLWWTDGQWESNCPIQVSNSTLNRLNKSRKLFPTVAENFAMTSSAETIFPFLPFHCVSPFSALIQVSLT